MGYEWFNGKKYMCYDVTADDIEPSCMKCNHIDDYSDDMCDKSCGAKNGWKSFISTICYEVNNAK
jgi:hypothetical protein